MFMISQVCTLQVWIVQFSMVTILCSSISPSCVSCELFCPVCCCFCEGINLFKLPKYSLNLHDKLFSSGSCLILQMNEIATTHLVSSNDHIECFHSRDQWVCFSTKTKGNVSIRIESNSQRISWEHQRGRRDVTWKHYTSFFQHTAVS